MNLRRNPQIGALVVLTLLVAFPAVVAAHHHDGEEIEPPPQLDEEDTEEARPVAGGDGSVDVDTGDHLIDVAVGLRLGAAGVAGHGFDDNENVEDDQGQIPRPGSFWNQPEYYPHFGVGPTGGLTLEGRYGRFIGVETGLFYSQDNASGYVDKNHAQTGERLATIHSDQITSAYHIPLLLKGSVPGEYVRPFISLGLMFVLQQDSELNYSQEPGDRGSEYDQQAVDQLDERNQIEPTNYTQLHGSAGVELVVGDIRIPLELRLGYTLGYDEAMQSRAYGEDGQIIYDGVYPGHFGIFAGALYQFEFTM